MAEGDGGGVRGPHRQKMLRDVRHERRQALNSVRGPRDGAPGFALRGIGANVKTQLRGKRSMAVVKNGQTPAALDVALQQFQVLAGESWVVGQHHPSLLARCNFCEVVRERGG